jgi:hypothetical protein
MTFTDYNQFIAAISPSNPSPYTETFDTEGFPSLGPPASTPLNFSHGVFSYSIDSPGGLFFVSPGVDVAISTADASTAVVVTFTGNKPTAVGANVFLTDVNGGFVAGTVIATLADGKSLSIDNAQLNSFAGFTSPVPIDSLSITSKPPVDPNNPLFPSIDNLIVGQALGTFVTPEPSTLAIAGLGALGFLAMGGRLRGRRPIVR